MVMMNANAASGGPKVYHQGSVPSRICLSRSSRRSRLFICGFLELIEIGLEETEEELLVAPLRDTAFDVGPEDEVETSASGLGELEVEGCRPLDVGSTGHV